MPELKQYLIIAELVSSAIFFIYFLIFRRIEKTCGKFIMFGMLASFYISLYDFLIQTNSFATAVYFFPFYFFAVFSLYPIAYHYLVCVTNDENSRLIVKIFSYMPALVTVIAAAFYLPLSYDDKYKFIHTNLLQINEGDSFFSLFQNIIFTLYYIQFFIFIVIFIQMYFRNKERQSSKSKEYNLFLPSWLFMVIAIFILYELIYFVLFIVKVNLNFDVLVQVVDFIVIVFIGILGIKHDELIISVQLDSLLKNKVVSSGNKIKSTDDETASKILDEIKFLLEEEKLYLNPALKIEHVAKKMHIPVNALSEIINKYEEKNFSQFINYYRIDEAKRLMLNLESESIKDIFLQVGFYTRSTFNRAFKSITNQTPTEFLNSTVKK